MSSPPLKRCSLPRGDAVTGGISRATSHRQRQCTARSSPDHDVAPPPCWHLDRRRSEAANATRCYIRGGRADSAIRQTTPAVHVYSCCRHNQYVLSSSSSADIVHRNLSRTVRYKPLVAAENAIVIVYIADQLPLSRTARYTDRRPLGAVY